MDISSTSTFVEMPATPQMTIADCRGTEDAGRSGQTEVFEAAARATPSTLMIQEYDPGIPVPLHRRTRKKIWPRLTFPSAYYSRRFEVVTEHFKKAVDKHDRLQDVAHNINYHPAMVGATPDDAKPSILVLCRQEDTSDLVSLFDDAFLARIRCASHSRPRLPSVISGTRTRTRDTRPDFWVYYYPSATDPTIRNAGSDVEFADVHLSSSITFCGALVEYNGRKATIGLTIEIDGMSRLLTVEHLFDEALPGTDTKSFEEDEAIWLYESDDSEDSREEFDDFGKGYNRPLDKRHSTTPEVPAQGFLRSSAAERLHPSVGGPTAEEPAEQDARVSPSHDSSGAACVQGQRIETTVQPGGKSPYLDWACLSVDEATLNSRRNNFMRTGEDTWARLEAMAESPPAGAAPVFMVSGVHGVRHGVIMSELSCIGSRPGQQMCKAWTMTLDSPQGILPGDCGSIVADQNSCRIYGHVVGSNHLGHAYVVPLWDTFDQIKTTLNAVNVAFPSPTGLHQPVLSSGHLITSQAENARYEYTSPTGQYQSTFESSQVTASQAQKEVGPIPTGLLEAFIQVEDSEFDRQRQGDILHIQGERFNYVERLPGPPRSMRERLISPADEVRAHERAFGRQQQQHLIPPTVYYNDQFETLPAASGYAPGFYAFEDFDMSNNSRSNESSRSKRDSSQQKHKRSRH